MALTDLRLSRSALDKVTDDRFSPGLIERLLLDPTTSLLPVRAGRAPLQPGGVAAGPAAAGAADPTSGTPTLRTLHGEAAAALVAALGGAAAVAAGGTDPDTSPVPVLLGRFPTDDPRAPGVLVGLLLPEWTPGRFTADGGPEETEPPALSEALAAPEGELRELGVLLGDTDSGALTEAVALQNWHRAHPRCPRCGGPTSVGAAGHERVCTTDGTTHHPRHDPAVIMTVSDPAGRLLLGHQGRWPQGRFSAFAGFVEPGESLEHAVARELLEEAGIRVREVTYLGSQPWPFPASLMLAFHAETDDTDALPDGDEITEARWFSREELLAAVTSGEVTVPGAVSVARRLIERWFGGPLPEQATWR